MRLLYRKRKNAPLFTTHPTSTDAYTWTTLSSFMPYTQQTTHSCSLTCIRHVGGSYAREERVIGGACGSYAREERVIGGACGIEPLVRANGRGLSGSFPAREKRHRRGGGENGPDGMGRDGEGKGSAREVVKDV